MQLIGGIDVSDALSGSVIQKGLKLEDVFFEVEHNETLGLRRKGQLRLFHMVMHSNRFFTDDLQAVLYRNLARYVFSRAKLEDFKKNEELETAVSQAMRIMRENGGADSEGTGNGLSEILIYVFLEEILHAPKIMSRVELYTELAQFKSECKGIHLLAPEDGESELHYQLVFGASQIIGDLQDAIDCAFDAILKIEGHENREIVMVQKTAMDRMVEGKEAERLKEIIIPNPGQSTSYDTAYGVFLGYSLGLRMEDRGEEFESLAKKKMEYDIKYYAPYIAKKIKDNGLDNHSFYFYVVPFNDAEHDKHEIMDNVLKGGVIV